MLCSLAATAVAAVAVVFSTYAVIRLQKDAEVAAEDRAAKLAVELEHTKTAAKQIDFNLLHEQRLTANERWRLERIERAVLPRSTFVNWGLLTERLKSLHLEGVSLVTLDEENLEEDDFALQLSIAFQNAGIKIITFAVSKDDRRLFGQSSSGLFLITVDDKGNKLADMLWQEFQIGGGSTSIFPDRPSKIPRNINCLVIGSNNWSVGPPSGQAGEGLDQFGRPVPAPQ